MTRLALGVILGFGLISAATGGQVLATAPAHRAVTTTEARKAIIRRYIAIWESGRVDRLGGIIGTGYVGHAASGDRDIAGLRVRIAAFRAAYPDMRFTIDDQLADGDRVVTRMTAVGRSGGSGQSVRLVGINISRFVGNRIVEEWPAWEPVTAAAARPQ